MAWGQSSSMRIAGCISTLASSASSSRKIVVSVSRCPRRVNFESHLGPVFKETQQPRAIHLLRESDGAYCVFTICAVAGSMSDSSQGPRLRR